MKEKILDGQTAIVTGAGRGIGRAVALALAREGADLILGGNHLPRLEEVRSAAEALGRSCEIVTGDIAQPETGRGMAERAISRFGRIDLLVNNAGINDRTGTGGLTPEGWRRVLCVNLDGVFFACQAVLPQMERQRSGRIVNITSANGVTPHPNAAPSYGASKAGVNYLTKHLAYEYARCGIRVNAVQCGPIESDMTRQWSGEYRRESLAKIPLGRLGTPEDVANSVLFLASELSSFMTGAILNLSGGKLMQ